MSPRLRCSNLLRAPALLAALLALVAVTSGCARMVSSMAADTLSSAILNADDPVLVQMGLPAYMLLMDGFIQQSPEDVQLLAAGAQLFAMYGSRFEPDPARAIELTAKARRYGERAMCAAHAPACQWRRMDHATFVHELEGVRARNIEALYAYSVSWLSHLDATSEDWIAVAELPWVEAALERVLALDEAYEGGAIHGYLGTLNALRPPALGGRPEVARRHFERAIELSGGSDLVVKVEYARRYARLMFDQELHDRLLQDVLSAPVEAPGLTLFNVLAKQEAEQLLASSEEYF